MPAERSTVRTPRGAAVCRWWGACAIGLVALAAIGAGLESGGAAENGGLEVAPAVAPGGVSYNREVRPILADTCFKCHGPDAKVRQAGLRLDSFEGATAKLEAGGAAIVPGDTGASRLVRRITSKDPKFMMPPPDSGRTLSPAQIETLVAWVGQGAEYQKHWSLIAPVRVEPPRVRDEGWVRNPIDRFILARLEAETHGWPEDGQAVAREADRRTLIRRLSLDLTGLPPTVEEVAAFLADDSEDAYERLVDRLLASPRYGERMAMEWMDAARYGDTNGYHIDNERSMWRWRDWVIDAYNANRPFDEFTIEQLAGDLLPDATLAQRIASGFHRNHMINFEGGAIPEEYLSAYLVDRVNTTSTVWLGLTLNCAQCHDHKYDPVTQEEYYRLYAFFNNVPEQGLDGQKGNSAPFVRAPLPAQAAAHEEVLARLQALDERMNGPWPEVDAGQTRWEASEAATLADEWHVLTPASAASSTATKLEARPDGSLLAAGVDPATGKVPATETFEITTTCDGPIAALRLEALADASLPVGGPGRAYNGNFVLTEFEATIATAGDPAAAQPVKFVAALADYSQTQFPVRNAIDGDAKTGWAVLAPQGGAMGRDRIAVFVPDRVLGTDGPSILTIRLRHDSQYAEHSIGRIRLAALVRPERYEQVRPSDRGVWHICGPIPGGTKEDALAKDFGPEAAGVNLDARYGGGPVDTGGVPREAGEEFGWLAKEDYADGQVNKLPTGGVTVTYLYRTITAPLARSVTASLGSDDGIKVWLNGKLVHENPTARAVAPNQDTVQLDLAAGTNSLLLKIIDFGGDCGFYFDLRSDGGFDTPLDIARVLSVPVPERSETQVARVRGFYRERHSPEWREVAARAAVVREEEQKVLAMIPTAMVMEEMAERRPTYVLRRGEYDQPEQEVQPGVPACLPPLALAEGQRADRLALARWLMSAENPLVARVAVNRIWQMLFGAGLVRTSEDFGIQGEWPSHPELLDWLAVEYRQSGWDTKRLLRLIVTSATYRQSARVSPEMLALDPENRLLGRAPRPRLSAEMVRDNALAISGLLVERQGGPSVRPYQPPGLWEETAIDPDGSEWTAQYYVQDKGESLYRRSLYTFRKRSVPHPAMGVFDAPSREFCVVRRGRTNTPLQALVLMNDPTYVEAARALAERVMHEAEEPDARISLAFERAAARPPRQEELRLLADLHAERLAVYRADPAAAAQLLKVGDSARDETLDAAEHAAMASVMSVILNLDEVICRN